MAAQTHLSLRARFGQCGEFSPQVIEKVQALLLLLLTAAAHRAPRGPPPFVVVAEHVILRREVVFVLVVQVQLLQSKTKRLHYCFKHTNTET